MTERLTQLLTAEVDLLDVPPAPVADVLGRGRGLRRRHRAGRVVAGLAVLAVIGGGALVVDADRRTDDDPHVGRDPVAAGPQVSSDPGVVFSIGPTVYLDGGRVSGTVDDVVVKSMYYTSAGVLVRHGENSYSDGGGPQRFSLVTSDGTVTPLAVTTDEVVPGVDVDQPYLAYAEVVGGTVEVVVHDVATDEEVARVAVPDARDWGGWSAPPVSLNGDDVYVGTADVTRVVDWRTGAVRDDPATTPGYPPAFYDGRTTRSTGDSLEVVDTATGETLLNVAGEAARGAYLDVSPDGRFAMRIDQAIPESGVDPAFQVYDVDTGDAATFAGDASGWSWTADGELFALADDGTLTTCSAATGDCSEEKPDLAVLPDSAPGEENFSDDLVLGNEVRES